METKNDKVVLYGQNFIVCQDTDFFKYTLDNDTLIPSSLNTHSAVSVSIKSSKLLNKTRKGSNDCFKFTRVPHRTAVNLFCRTSEITGSLTAFSKAICFDVAFIKI